MNGADKICLRKSALIVTVNENIEEYRSYLTLPTLFLQQLHCANSLSHTVSLKRGPPLTSVRPRQGRATYSVSNYIELAIITQPGVMVSRRYSGKKLTVLYFVVEGFCRLP